MFDKCVHILSIQRGTSQVSSIMQLNTATGTSVLSILLLLVYVIFLGKYQGDAKMFCFGWTQRSGVNNARSIIPPMYRDNLDTSVEALDRLHKDSMNMAYCMPTDYGAQLSWKEADISPLCRCLDSAHLEYEKAVCPHGLCLHQAAMNSPQVSPCVCHLGWLLFCCVIKSTMHGVCF